MRTIASMYEHKDQVNVTSKAIMKNYEELLDEMVKEAAVTPADAAVAHSHDDTLDISKDYEDFEEDPARLSKRITTGMMTHHDHIHKQKDFQLRQCVKEVKSLFH